MPKTSSIAKTPAGIITTLSILFLLGYLLFLGFTEDPIRTGDGHEYALMLESFWNHGSPDLQKCDIDSLMQLIDSKATQGYFKESINVYFPLFHGPRSLLKGSFGYVFGLNEKAYCYHFWFYSLINIPSKALLHAFGRNEACAFQVTNVLIFVMIFLIVIFSHETNIAHLYLFILFVFSGSLFYFRWSHPEVFSAGCFLGSLIFFDQKKYLTAAFLTAFGSLQNPPIALFIPVLLGHHLATYWRAERNQDHWLKNTWAIIRAHKYSALGYCCVLLITSFPSAFYWFYFGKPNLLVYYGGTSTSNITGNRLFSLFFDLNQGMVVVIPLIMLITTGLMVTRLLSRKMVNRSEFTYLWPIGAMLFMACTSIQTTNFNSGQSVFNRYCYWLQIPILYYFVCSLNYRKLFSHFILMFTLFTQIFISTHFQGWHSESEGGYLKMKPFARWVMNNYSNLYNPPPEIFAERVQGNENALDARRTYCWHDDNGKVRKVLYHKTNIPHSIDGWNSALVKSRLKKHTNAGNGWAYINL